MELYPLVAEKIRLTIRERKEREERVKADKLKAEEEAKQMAKKMEEAKLLEAQRKLEENTGNSFWSISKSSISRRDN
jgi:ribosomal protein L9